jgi:hypothetical protein
MGISSSLSGLIANLRRLVACSAIVRISVSSFNVFGVEESHDVPGFLDLAFAHLPPGSADLLGIGFQEVWFQSQLSALLDRLLAGRRETSAFTRVTAHRAADSSYKCLVPDLPAAGIPGIRRLELSSGLVLCVKGTVRDAFFTRFRGGFTPDSFSNKGVLSALVRSDLGTYALLTTHFHDYSNDALGGARRNNIQALASVVRWIDDNWRVPIVLVGDFNIDARRAHLTQPSVETVLYRQLITVRKAAGAFWFDVNARVNAPTPIITQNGGSHAIDHHLLSQSASTSNHRFETFVAGSDHQLIKSSWDVP